MKKRFNQIKVIINKKIKAIDNAYIVCNNINISRVGQLISIKAPESL